MWFNKNHLKPKKTIILPNLHGYVLPHAGTTYTGRIISHTLRFKPKKQFSTIVIIYKPVSKKPNVENKYYHEYYVPFKCLNFFVKDVWGMSNINFVPLNVDNPHNTLNNIDISKTLIVVSADFSHFLSMQEAIKLENCGAKSILHRSLNRQRKCVKVIDHPDSFDLLYNIIPNNQQLQWIGRSRSSGLKGVGYLSFLIRETPNPNIKKPDGIFVTAYDKMMRQRECLGTWYDTTKIWNREKQQELVDKVIRQGSSSSRLTGGLYTDYPITNITIAYLYRSNEPGFIRGWHGMLHNSFYLSDVFLENTYENGKWIQPEHDRWLVENGHEPVNFNKRETIMKLKNKSNSMNDVKIDIFDTEVLHQKVI